MLAFRSSWLAIGVLVALVELHGVFWHRSDSDSVHKRSSGEMGAKAIELHKLIPVPHKITPQHALPAGTQ